MNLFNRVFTIITLLLLIPLAAIAIVAPVEGVANLAAWLASLEGAVYGRLILTIVSALIIVVSFALLYMEMRRPQRRTAILGKMEGATAEMSIDAIAQRLRREVMALAEVQQVDPIVTPRRSGVDVRVIVFTSPDSDVPAKAAEVGRVVRENMEQRMGLRVGQVRVNIRHLPQAVDTAPSAAH